VTSTPAVDPTGAYVYMNTVGCYTFPSVGDSDSVFKLDAATGMVLWKNRVDEPEQFGLCENDGSVDCGTDADCAGVGGECRQACVGDGGECRVDGDCAGGMCRGVKDNYHDFGFLNGPLLIEAAHGDPTCPTDALVVSGSKNGTLYALCEATGAIVWKHVVVPTPVSPGFAGFGLFNGAIAHADGRIFAALGSVIPSRVCDNDHTVACSSDAQCSGGSCPSEPEHLRAFEATDGSLAWSAEIGRSWAHVRAEGGVVYAGTGTFGGGVSEVYAYDATTGARLQTFPLPPPKITVSRPLVVRDTVYIGYGLGGRSGVRAFSLCGNGELDDGEACDDAGPTDCCAPDCTVETPCGTTTTTLPPACTGAAGCDDGNPCTADGCDPAAGCSHVPDDAAACSDGDACTVDRCADGACLGAVATVDDVGCALDALEDAQCEGEVLPKKLQRAIVKKTKRARKLFDKAARASLAGKPGKAAKLQGKAASQLEAIATQADKAAGARKATQRISQQCKERLVSVVRDRQQVIGGFTF
jgi:outer membrane protein assembly factor BamB